MRNCHKYEGIDVTHDFYHFLFFVTCCHRSKDNDMLISGTNQVTIFFQFSRRSECCCGWADMFLPRYLLAFKKCRVEIETYDFGFWTNKCAHSPVYNTTIQCISHSRCVTHFPLTLRHPRQCDTHRHTIQPTTMKRHCHAAENLGEGEYKNKLTYRKQNKEKFPYWKSRIIPKIECQ